MLPDSPVALAAAAGLLGLVVGSFLNVVIHRLPRMLEREWQAQARELLAAASGAAPAAVPDEPPYNLMTPGSACPQCHARIKPQHNIPVLSWIALRGRCAACAAPIPARYPVIELTTAVVSALVAFTFGATPACAGALVLSWGLIALTVIDLDHQLLPDSITLPLLWAGLAFNLVWPATSEGRPFTTLDDAVIGAIAGYLSLWSVYQAFKLVTGKEGMGYGDFKLFAALGAWLGWQMLPLIIVLSAATGAAVGIALLAFRKLARGTPIPFGPYLAAAGFIALLWGRPILDAYWQVARP